MDSMRKKILALLAGIMVSYMPMAQTTVKKDSSWQYDMHVSATALFSGGNLARTVTQNRLTASLGNRAVQFVTENSYRFGKNFTRVVENDFLTRNYVRLLPQKRLYAFLLGVYETNYRRSIQSRWQMGAGAAINFYRRGKDYLRFGFSGVYEKAHYKVGSFNLPEYNGSSQVEAVRAMVRLGGQHTVLDGHLVLKHDTWLMQGLQKANNYRWHSLLGLQIPVYKGLAFKTDYEYTYESLAISSNNPFGYPSSTGDWVLSFGLSYDINKGK
jgi:Protein of unknown function, DUF481